MGGGGIINAIPISFSIFFYLTLSYSIKHFKNNKEIKENHLIDVFEMEMFLTRTSLSKNIDFKRIKIPSKVQNTSSKR